MTDIFLTGNTDDNEIEMLIKSRLSKTYTLNYIKENRFYETGSGYNLIIFENENPIISTVSGVLMMKEYGNIPEDVPKNITAIVNSDNEEQIKAVQKKHIPVITCGTCNKSTISFTSETDEKLMISLNRSVTALSGKIIEPLEIPVEKGGAKRYSLMSYTALRLLLDDFNSDLGKLI